MATAPLEQTETEGADSAEDASPPNYETDARRFGWTPKEEFKGDPSRWVDAETFAKRGEELMPILKAQNKALIKRLDAMERTGKQAADFFSKAEQRAYERAVSDIRRQQEEAVEAGDLEAHRAASKELDKLEKPKAVEADVVDPDVRVEEFADWGKANKWYGTNATMRAYADAQADKLAKSKGGFLDRADLDAVADKVREKFEDEFAEEFATKANKPRPRSAVEAVGSVRPGRTGKTFNDLPAEARAACDKWVKQGLIKSRDDYVKSYDWS